MIHVPVLLKEVIQYLDPRPGENFVDATFGGGGHAREILKRISPGGRLLGVDWDREAIKGVKGEKGEEKGKDKTKGSKLETRSENLIKSEPSVRSGIEFEPFNLILEQGNFAEIERISAQYFPNGVDGVLFDFGLSSDQLENSGRGFSYLKDEPLDTRYGADERGLDADQRGKSLTAAEIVNTWTEKELEKIFREYGEEKNSKKIARTIVEARRQKKILTTGELVKILNPALEKDKFYLAKANLFQGRGRAKTLSRIFQALRIAVNDELENIKQGLAGAWQILKPQGRLAAISFHSLEDRLVKNFFVGQKKAGEGEILTKKPVTPTQGEIKSNPRSRSAKLRAIKKK